MTTFALGPNLPGAACTKVRAPLWDDRVDGESAGQRGHRISDALVICRRCPEIVACLAARLADDTLGSGVWGGRLFSQAALRQQHCDECSSLFYAAQPRLYCGAYCRTAGRNRKRAAELRSARRVGGQLRGLTHCQVCDTQLTEQQRSKRARNCSTQCREAAKAKHRSQRLVTTDITNRHRERLVPNPRHRQGAA